MEQLIVTDKIPSSTPATASQAYVTDNGFLTEAEVLDLLYALLHAERAGARVCALSLRDAPTKAHQKLLRTVQRDEAKSCSGLIESLSVLAAEPDDTVGDFVEKCLAIDDFHERLKFLNRGQGWVARKITEALPRIRQQSIKRQLDEMLEDHRRNISIVNDFLVDKT